MTVRRPAAVSRVRDSQREQLCCALRNFVSTDLLTQARNTMSEYHESNKISAYEILTKLEALREQLTKLDNLTDALAFVHHKRVSTKLDAIDKAIDETSDLIETLAERFAEQPSHYYVGRKITVRAKNGMTRHRAFVLLAQRNGARMRYLCRPVTLDERAIWIDDDCVDSSTVSDDTFDISSFLSDYEASK